MRKVLILLLIAILGILTVKAQRPDRPNLDPKEIASKTIDDLSKQITITPAVQDSLKVTFIHFYDEMKKERDAGNRPDRQAMESKRDAKVKTFLTEEQFQTYQKFMEERRTRRGPGQDGPPQGPGGM